MKHEPLLRDVTSPQWVIPPSPQLLFSPVVVGAFYKHLLFILMALSLAISLLLRSCFCCQILNIFAQLKVTKISFSDFLLDFVFFMLYIKSVLYTEFF